MKRHVEQIHEDNKNYKCSRCDKAFNNEFRCVQEQYEYFFYLRKVET